MTTITISDATFIGLISLLLAAITIVIGLAQWLAPGNSNPTLRYIVAGICLVIVFFAVGVGSYFLVIAVPSSAPTAISSAEPTATPAGVEAQAANVPTDTPSPVPSATSVPPTDIPTVIPTNTDVPPTATTAPTPTPSPLPTDTPTAIPTSTNTPLPAVGIVIPTVTEFCIDREQLDKAINGNNTIPDLDKLADTQAARFIAALKQLNPGIDESEAIKIMNNEGPRNRCDDWGGSDEVPGCGPRKFNGDNEIIWDGGSERVVVQGTVERKDLKITGGVNIEQITPLGGNILLDAISDHGGICVMN